MVEAMIPDLRRYGGICRIYSRCSRSCDVLRWLAKTMTERRLERPRSRAACCAARAALSRVTIVLNFPLALTWKAISANQSRGGSCMNFVAICCDVTRGLSTPYHLSVVLGGFLPEVTRALLTPAEPRTIPILRAALIVLIVVRKDLSSRPRQSQTRFSSSPSPGVQSRRGCAGRLPSGPRVTIVR